MKIKTIDLFDRALDWATLLALGYQPARWEKREWGRTLVRAPERAYAAMLMNEAGFSVTFSSFCPSSSGDHCVALMGSNLIGVTPKFVAANAMHPKGFWAWQASMPSSDGGLEEVIDGPTAPVAVLRCLVFSKLGTEVEIPDVILAS